MHDSSHEQASRWRQHKDKRSKADTKQGMEESGKKDQQVGSMSDKCQEMTKDQKDALIQTIERNEGYRRLITTISEAEDWEYEIQRFGKQLQEKSEIGEERAKVMEWGMRWAVEARKRRRDEEKGQSMGQEQDKKDKQMHFGEEDSLEETQTESTDEPKVMSRLEEVRKGRGSACLIQGTDEKCLTNETCRKGKGKGNGGKGEHDGKAGGAGSKGRQHVENLVMDEDQENMRATTGEENHEEDVRKLLEMVEKEEMKLEMMQQEEMEHEEQRGRVAPNMGAGASHPQATSDLRKKKKETRVLRWADCNDEEERWETTEERPPGLEEVENKQEEKKEQEAERKQKQEQEQERRASRRRERSRGERRRRERKREERRKRKSKRERRRRERSRGERRRRERKHKESAGSARGKEGSGRARETGERGQCSGGARKRSEGSRRARKRSEGSRGARRACQEGKGSGGANGARERS